MDLTEATHIVEQHIEGLRERPYSELKHLVQNRAIQTLQIKGPSGVTYQLEVEAFWDDRSKGNVRIIVAIDDGGKSAFHPLTRSFIKTPDGSFVGE